MGFNLVKRVRSPVVLGGVVLGSLSTFLWAGYQEKRFSDLSSVGTYVKVKADCDPDQSLGLTKRLFLL